MRMYMESGEQKLVKTASLQLLISARVILRPENLPNMHLIERFIQSILILVAVHVILSVLQLVSLPDFILHPNEVHHCSERCSSMQPMTTGIVIHGLWQSKELIAHQLWPKVPVGHWSTMVLPVSIAAHRVWAREQWYGFTVMQSGIQAIDFSSLRNVETATVFNILKWNFLFNTKERNKQSYFSKSFFTDDDWLIVRTKIHFSTFIHMILEKSRLYVEILNKKQVEKLSRNHFSLIHNYMSW